MCGKITAKIPGYRLSPRSVRILHRGMQGDERTHVTKLIINPFSQLYCKRTYKGPESTLNMQLYTVRRYPTFPL